MIVIEDTSAHPAVRLAELRISRNRGKARIFPIDFPFRGRKFSEPVLVSVIDETGGGAQGFVGFRRDDALIGGALRLEALREIEQF